MFLLQCESPHRKAANSPPCWPRTNRQKSSRVESDETTSDDSEFNRLITSEENINLDIIIKKIRKNEINFILYGRKKIEFLLLETF